MSTAEKKKRVSTDATDLIIVERPDYKTSLERADGLPMGLWMVTGPSNEPREDGHHTSSIVRYVLAESATGAIGQATSAYGSESDKYIAVRLPLFLRGWGHSEF